MKKSIVTVCLMAGTAMWMSCSAPEQQPTAISGAEGTEVEEGERVLVWSDEFKSPGNPDSSRWAYDLGDGCPDICGWGNNELQYYTDRPENVRIEDGKLIIEAHKEPFKGSEYTSARLVSREKGDWRYGYIEARAKLPQGTGVWPAIWMLPTNWEYGGWPASGEIDIMEHVGYEPETIYGTVHTEAFNHGIGTQKGDSILVADVQNQFHTYAIDWSPEKIDFLVDEEIFFTFKNEGTGFKAWPFDQPFHLLMNLAVGGNWGGAKGIDESIWPQRMEVDYVRVYQYPEEAVE